MGLNTLLWQQGLTSRPDIYEMASSNGRGSCAPRKGKGEHMDAEEANGLPLKSLAQKLERLERENAALRDQMGWHFILSPLFTGVCGKGLLRHS
jgi:hypothetical protein